jgi:hypothetical protein
MERRRVNLLLEKEPLVTKTTEYFNAFCWMLKKMAFGHDGFVVVKQFSIKVKFLIVVGSNTFNYKYVIARRTIAAARQDLLQLAIPEAEIKVCMIVT